MKSELDVGILWSQMEKFLAQQEAKNPPQATVFKTALHVLDWVLEHEDSGDFAAKADVIVADFKKRSRNRNLPKPKRIAVDDHFAI